jgi:hypothetical protein
MNSSLMVHQAVDSLTAKRNQLLFIINLYALQNDKFSEDQVKRVEEMLVNKLPEDIKSEISVLNWLKENGKYF